MTRSDGMDEWERMNDATSGTTHYFAGNYEVEESDDEGYVLLLRRRVRVGSLEHAGMVIRAIEAPVTLKVVEPHAVSDEACGECGFATAEAVVKDPRSIGTKGRQ